MKQFLVVLLIISNLSSFGQKKTEYYDNGSIKSEWEIDSNTKNVINYFYFETREIKSIGIFDSIGVLQDYFHFNQNGDTISKSHILEFKSQPKKDLNFINWQYTKGGIGYYFEKKVKGKKFKDGDIIKVWYIGYFIDGSQFDNSDITGITLEVEFGSNKFLKSFQDGLKLFKVGQKSYIKISPELGYGNKPAGNIPPNSTLIYYVEIRK